MAGVGIWVLTLHNVVTREQALSDTNLNIEERWRIEGSLLWWKDFSAPFYVLAAGLFLGGLFAIVLSDPFQGKTKGAVIRWRIRYLSKRIRDLKKYVELRKQSEL